MVEAETGEARAVLFTYNTEHLAYKDKVRFYYALKGRDGKSGIVKDANIDHLGKTVLLVPESQSGKVEAFLRFWKCEHSSRKVIVYA